MKKYLLAILLGVALGLPSAALWAYPGGTSAPSTCSAPTPAARSTSPAPTSAPKVTIGKNEASCPVTGTVMLKSRMVPITYHGKTYFLCCKDCIATFKANPEKYIKHPAAPKRGM